MSKKSIDDAVPKEIRDKVAKAKDKEMLGSEYPYSRKMNREEYEAKKLDLQVELLKMQNWVISEGKKVIFIFEGRDASGKGGTIKRFMEHLNPRAARVVALAKPTNKEMGEWYFQRYVRHLPTAGEMVFFDRSWYNRGVVEPVMGFCSKEQHKIFMKDVPLFEKMLVDSDIKIFKFWFSVSRPEQYRRFKERETNKLKHWKLSPVDQDSLGMWDEYTKAITKMLSQTDIPEAPWAVFRSDGKKRARLNCMRYVLNEMNYPDKDKKIVTPANKKIVGSSAEMYKSIAS